MGNHPDFTIKDSGKRADFEGGMVRDTAEGKIDYTLILDGPMFERWAAHLTKGGQKYEKRNWLKGTGSEVLERYRESALRHFIQWFKGETDEDHAAAVFFNINGAEYTKAKGDADALWRLQVEANKRLYDKPGRVIGVQGTNVSKSGQ